MAQIRDRRRVAEALHSGILAIKNIEHQTIGKTEQDVSSLLNVNKRTFQYWEAAKGVPDRIETGLLWGVAWLAITRGKKDLDWLIGLFRATDLLVVDETPSSDWVRHYLAMVRISGELLSEAEIASAIEQLFGEQKPNFILDERAEKGDSAQADESTFLSPPRTVRVPWKLILAVMPLVALIWILKPAPLQRYKLAFNRNTDLYTINDDGSALVLVAAFAGSCTWSPDGGQLACDTTRNGRSQIYGINADGSNPQPLTSSIGNDSLPSWSPDGTRIAFQSARDGNNDIYVMDVDGSSQKRLTDDPANDYFAAWSPDSSKIVFVSERDGNAEIYIMHADGSDQQRITTHPAEDTFPDWSPDGKRIVFASKRDGSAQIFVMNVDGSGVERLTNYAMGVNDYPVWSPDGSKIAFDSSRHGNWSVYVMNVDGSEQMRLTPHDGAGYFAPAWRPG